MKMVTIGSNSHPLSNRKKTVIDYLRTMTWARGVALRAGIRTGKELELWMVEELGFPKAHATSLWNEYLVGKRRCFTQWAPEAPSLWVQRAEKIWSGSRDWFCTPVWYLMEDMEYLPSQIKACIELLPLEFKEIFYPESHAQSPAGLLLGELWPNRIYEMTKPVSPWALGTMACAFRRAELAGQNSVYLRAGIGMIWMLDRLVAAQDPWVQEPINKFRDLILKRLNDVVYPGSTPLKFPISGEHLTHFGNSSREFFANRSVPIDLEHEIAVSAQLLAIGPQMELF